MGLTERPEFFFSVDETHKQETLYVILFRKETDEDVFYEILFASVDDYEIEECLDYVEILYNILKEIPSSEYMYTVSVIQLTPENCTKEQMDEIRNRYNNDMSIVLKDPMNVHSKRGNFFLLKTQGATERITEIVNEDVLMLESEGEDHALKCTENINPFLLDSQEIELFPPEDDVIAVVIPLEVENRDGLEILVNEIKSNHPEYTEANPMGVSVLSRVLIFTRTLWSFIAKEVITGDQ